MVKIAVVIGSTRPGRRGDAVARWVHALGQKRSDAELEVVDIADFELPLLDEPVPASRGDYSKPHTRRWADKIAGFDGFVFVTPEYNHAPPAALTNAISFLSREWANKAAGFVGYGALGAQRAVEHLRLIMGELQVADVRAQVALSLFSDFERFTTFAPQPHQEAQVAAVLDQVIAWAGALKPLRAAA